MDSNERFKKGVENRNKVLGSKSWKEPDDFSRPMTKLVTEICWGDIWGDKTLPFKTRSMINLGMLTALGQQKQLGQHVQGALRNGVTKDEIRAVIMQACIYCGVPKAVAAFSTVVEAIKAYEAEESQ